jgi:hypothetical protein
MLLREKWWNSFFGKYEGENIILPEKFLPEKNFIQYHNDVIFENWR